MLTIFCLLVRGQFGFQRSTDPLESKPDFSTSNSAMKSLCSPEELSRIMRNRHVLRKAINSVAEREGISAKELINDLLDRSNTRQSNLIDSKSKEPTDFLKV